MQVEKFIEKLLKIGVRDFVGVPDSTLQPFCDYMNSGGEASGVSHYTTPNEGSAVGMAMGMYLAAGTPACVYMQNSGIGNALNPITSLAKEEVYSVPMLFLVGWRGEPGTKDEPQHKFMGKITIDIFRCMEIKTAILDENTSEQDFDQVLRDVEEAFSENRQFAIIIKKNTFQYQTRGEYHNAYTIVREEAIGEILRSIKENDAVVSTTGKISREVYEQSDIIWGQHAQDFLTVGGMGHASMIALGLAEKWSDKVVYCIDGDGAALMHMGNMAFVGKQDRENIVHICLNNEAHESVGGMPTGAQGISYCAIAKDCGYRHTFEIVTLESLKDILLKIRELTGPVFLEVKVKLDSREDLGRPKETAVMNKLNFMNYHGRIK